MPKKVLVADDSITIQRAVQISFANHPDFVLEFARDGDEALAKAKAAKPDVVVADVVMPKKSGYDVADALKGQGIPVVLLKVGSEAYNVARATAAGVAGAIQKPFETTALVELVTAASSGTAPKAAAAPAAAKPVAAPKPAAPPPPKAAPVSLEDETDSWDLGEPEAAPAPVKASPPPAPAPKPAAAPVAPKPPPAPAPKAPPAPPPAAVEEEAWDLGEPEAAPLSAASLEADVEVSVETASESEAWDLGEPEAAPATVEVEAESAGETWDLGEPEAAPAAAAEALMAGGGSEIEVELSADSGDAWDLGEPEAAPASTPPPAVKIPVTAPPPPPAPKAAPAPSMPPPAIAAPAARAPAPVDPAQIEAAVRQAVELALRPMIDESVKRIAKAISEEFPKIAERLIQNEIDRLKEG